MADQQFDMDAIQDALDRIGGPPIEVACRWLGSVLDHAEEYPASIEVDTRWLRGLRDRLNAIDLPKMCDGCPTVVAVTEDIQGVPLCQGCADSLAEDSKTESLALAGDAELNADGWPLCGIKDCVADCTHVDHAGVGFCDEHWEDSLYGESSLIVGTAPRNAEWAAAIFHPVFLGAADE